jgi:hypothetical protein
MTAKGGKIWGVTIRALGPDLKWRELATGTLDLESGNLLLTGEALPPAVRDELGEFRPGTHQGNAWEITVDNFVYQIRFKGQPDLP